MMPALFVAHGSPQMAIEDNLYTQFLNQLGKTLGKPRAIVLFSAHWEAPMQHVSDVDAYEMIYDFWGFPDSLYQIRYPAKGHHALAEEIESLLIEHGVPFNRESKRGLDHGAWVVLRLMYPNADIPVIAMSVNPALTSEEQYQIGMALSSLRAKDVLIIGSGGTVHNLRALRFDDNGKIDDWAIDFDEWLSENLLSWNLPSLFYYLTVAKAAKFAVPPHGTEHFIPIFYAMGAADDVQKAKLLHRSYRFGNLSQSVWQFG
jgi:4,5-DOPA dioxygenase extradiol